jgi:hypothetical protein
VVEPGGAENTSDPDLLDVSMTLASALTVDILIVPPVVSESLDVQSTVVSAQAIDLVLYPPLTMDALDVRTALTQADSQEYLLYPPLQGPESMDVQTKLASADKVAL